MGVLDWLSKGGGDESKPLSDWRQAPVFSRMSEEELEVVAPLVRRRELKKGEVLVEEGTPATDLFVVQEGKLAIVKGKGLTELVVDEAGAGGVIGEVSLFDELPRAASVRAVEPTKVWVIDFHDLRPDGGLVARSSMDPRPKPARRAYHRLLESLATVMADRVRIQGDRVYEGAREREVMGRFVISILLLICLYTFMLSGLDVIGDYAPANTTLISVPLQVVFALGSVWFIRSTGYPLSSFGIGFKHLIGSLIEAAIFTLPALALVTGIKQIILWVNGNPRQLPLIAHTDVLARIEDPDVLRLFSIYAVTCVVQELIVRGALQSTLERILNGPRGRLQAILVAAMLFSMTHLHMSFLFATLAFLPGLFWGWLFSRRRNLAGVTLSHAVVGGYVFFILGVGI